MILQTSVSTGSVNSFPPVKVFSTDTLSMLTQLAPLSLTPAQVKRQSVGMMLVVKTKVLIVTSAMKNISSTIPLPCTCTHLTRLGLIVPTATNISLAGMRCTISLSSAQHLAVAVRDAPADIPSSVFICVDSP